MKSDPVLKSKRLYAIIPILLVIIERQYGLFIEAEDMEAVFDLAMGLAATGLVVWSKISEKLKLKEEEV